MPSLESVLNMICSVSNECCSPENLCDQVRTNGSIIILDCRSQADYMRSHIYQSICFSLPSLMQNRLKLGSLNVSCLIHNNEAKNIFSRTCQSQQVVLYDDSTTDITINPNSILSLLLKKLKQDGCSVSYLMGGFVTFCERFPECCQRLEVPDNAILGLRNLRISEDSSYGSSDSADEISTPQSSPFPVQVLPYLYLGNAKNSADINQLKKNGIRYILNVTPNVPNLFRDDSDFKYLQIPISDHWSQDLIPFFPDAIAFIDEARLGMNGILVHCFAGISRSVTVIVAYLMSKNAMPLNEAYDFVKKCKPNISPNFNFMGQLLEFEKALHQGDHSNCSPAVSFMSHDDRHFSAMNI